MFSVCESACVYIEGKTAVRRPCNGDGRETDRKSRQLRRLNPLQPRMLGLSPQCVSFAALAPRHAVDGRGHAVMVVSLGAQWWMVMDGSYVPSKKNHIVCCLYGGGGRDQCLVRSCSPWMPLWR